jgi:hypothetical protein
MVAANLAKMNHGGNRKSDQAESLPLEVSQAQAAEMLNVSDRSLRTAKKVEQQAVPELVNKVMQGSVSVSTAAIVSEESKQDQELFRENQLILYGALPQTPKYFHKGNSMKNTQN